MGHRGRKESSIASKKLTQAEKDLLDTQELAAMLFEANRALQSQLLDTQEILASVVERSNA